MDVNGEVNFCENSKKNFFEGMGGLGGGVVGGRGGGGGVDTSGWRGSGWMLTEK